MRELAIEILEEFTSCYSQVDEDVLTGMLERKQSEIVAEIFEEIWGAYNKTYHNAEFHKYKECLAKIEKKYIGKITYDDAGCVCCGEIIPEGRQVCKNCENK
jgi:hypothetical protein